MDESKENIDRVHIDSDEDKKDEAKDDVIEIRKEGIIKFFKEKSIWVLIVLIVAVILGVYIRVLPMQDHGGNPGLWDITTNTWTLGPDLDPFLFLRSAKTIVEQGSLPEIDMMRNVPLGFDNSKESTLLPYMIVFTYKIVNFFGNYSIEYAAVIFPVIMFGLTIISFFLLVREFFIGKSNREKFKANIIALISSFFLSVIPVILPRTIAGIPEKESAGFFFLFLSLYLFLKAWKSDSIKKAIIIGLLAGISTGLMGLIWGGSIYVYIPIAVASLIAFILNKVDKKEIIVYGIWVVTSFALILTFSDRFTLIKLILALNTGLATIVLFTFIVHLVLWNTKLSRINYLSKFNLPRNIISLIIAIIIGLILATVIFGPSFVVDKAKLVHQTIFKPTQGRWITTVAENRQPYFTEWAGSFGPSLGAMPVFGKLVENASSSLRNLPILFWMFFIGSVILFKKMLNKIRNKDAWVLTGLYILFFFGMVFSRYSPSSSFNGESFISKAVYYITAILLIGGFIYYYIKYYKRKDKSFESIDYKYLLLFAFFLFTLFTVRGAVRLIMTLAPLAAIFISYLIVVSIYKFRFSKKNMKIFYGTLMIIVLLLALFSFSTFYNSSKARAFNTVPSSYSQQWQKAMSWVRTETPEDAVFSHWWDYGYWVQTIGERATVTDGGNAITYWNYLMGRHVLTGDNQEAALEFLYNHDADYLLIDSTDIGKYRAFSSIGSDADFDRDASVGTFLLDERQTVERGNSTLLIYPGGIALDEDLIINDSIFPRNGAGIGAITIPLRNDQSLGQPSILLVYQNVQHNINLRYLTFGTEIIDFGSGIEAAAFLYPRIIPQGQGVSTNPTGAAMYLSPRLLRGYLAQKYILNDPFNNFPNFKQVHAQPSPVVESLNAQGLNLGDFIYFQGVQGPIKIWKIEYTGNEQIKDEYIDTDSSKYLSWEL